MDYSKTTLSYWQPQDFIDLENAVSYKELFVIAKRIIDRMPRPLAQVCGPIATGGLGSIEANLYAFNKEIKKLQDQGIHVFDQMPFEMPMQKLKKGLKPGEYATGILDDFYMPIVELGVVSVFYFMSNWQTSRGAQWEHQIAQEKGIEIRYL